jgi:hypothetical protein
MTGVYAQDPSLGSFGPRSRSVSVMASRVEKRRSNVGLPVVVEGAFVPSPQSGLAWLCFLLPGRPGEFRPEPPTDPDVNLPIHPARAP